jgi:hypothetical protein
MPHISGFRFGINPNPAVKICHFFLNTERTLADILRTAKAAQAALENGTALLTNPTMTAQARSSRVLTNITLWP